MELLSKYNKAFENKVSLSIAYALYPDVWKSYSELKEACGVSDGMLAGRIKALRDKKMLKQKRKFAGARPRTEYALTSKGQKAFGEHLEALRQIVKK